MPRIEHQCLVRHGPNFEELEQRVPKPVRVPTVVVPELELLKATR